MQAVYFYFVGGVPEGFQLRMVHILFRHGERLPKNSHASTQHTLQDCAVNTNVFERDDTLKGFVHTMTKFAGKQPLGSYFKKYDLFPNEKNCGRKDLTGTGAAQLVKLGKYFRGKYLTQSVLFSREIPLTDQLYICSSETARTYQSMIGFLYGFFNSTHFNLTNFNIFSSDHNFCSYDQPAQIKCNTKKGKVLRKEIDLRRSSYFLSSASREFLKSLKVSKANSTRIFCGTRIGCYKQLADMISLTYCRNRPKLCSNDQADCLHSSHFNGIWEKLYQENIFVNENPPEAKHYYATYYPILSKIVDRSKDYINAKAGHNGKKLFVYAGHNTSIFALLHILGLDGGRLINYASRITIELFEETSKNKTIIENKYYFRIFFEGVDITQYVIFCVGKTFRGLCEFSLLYDFVYNKMSPLLRESAFEN